MLRIGITGTHSTGKTTLARCLVEKLNNKDRRIILIKEQVRDVAADLSIQNVEEVARRGPKWFSLFQWEILRRQINSEQYAVKNGYSFVSDRTTLDNLAYYMLGNSGDSEAVRKMYEGIALKNMKRGYDLILYLPPAIPLEDDGFRQTDEEFRDKIDRAIRRLIALHGIACYTVKSIALNERVKEVLEAIPQKGAENYVPGN